ncbi:DUF3089 domain-containing protein [Maricurvus nonylphenolicus]|uniref:DUF3089 domain-containing protein n=1 Tax=Maricurvus nonylphenolicus TaxID=1008307 RepID=UPI0036F1B166
MKILKIIGITVAVLVLVVSGLVVTGYDKKLAMQAFAAYGKPDGVFRAEDAVAPPDYTKEEFWAALPGKKDPADLVPAGVSAITQGEGKVDTFFIHPTGFLNAGSWTSPMELDSTTEENTLWMMANQASAYNGCCNVYAPRYREANIFAYFSDAEVRDTILDFAYQDVKAAFEHYIQHENQGRPFILAGHSQGTHHAKRLLAEVINTSDLHQRMVAAYIIGAVGNPLSPAWFASMDNISACQSATDLHCVIHWDTMAEDSDPVERAEASLCTNPLTWEVNEEYAEAKLNEGAVVPVGTYNLNFGNNEDLATGQRFENMTSPIPHRTGAQCRNGTLFVASQKDSEFDAMGSGATGSYHGLDYALFYMNIHNNAKLKANTFLQQLNARKQETASPANEQQASLD